MSTQSHYPLLDGRDPGDIFAWWRGEAISVQRFTRQAQALAATLPEAGHAINLCEDRYLFLLGFVALMLRGQVNLLPPNRAPRMVEAIAADHPGCYSLVDAPLPGLALAQHLVEAVPDCGVDEARLPSLPAAQAAATVFTSGSTGQARAHAKTWGELVGGAQAIVAALGLEDGQATVVATVPPQHMYGLETSVLLPLAAGLSVHGGRPFFPADLQQALQQTPGPKLLVTTPLHLRACLGARLEWPRLRGIVSATAPLAAEDAAAAERLFGCVLTEIYGSSETGAIATRRTARTQSWQLHPGLALRSVGERVEVSGGHLPRGQLLDDVLELDAEGCFRLQGRHGDMLKIAGKRASLADLNLQLQSLPGVEDGVFIAPEPGRGERLAALVVAPQLECAEILRALQQRIDPVFLPRPIYRVAKLPRNDTGKLSREALKALLDGLRRG
jgi:acyl-coenzyme A synthetase/AMP-(fatty) acid ligase